MKRFNLRPWLRDRAADVAIDESLLQQSPTARASKRLIQASMIVHVLMPVLVILVIITLTALPVLAQSPGGSIFGGNDQTVGNGVREAIKWGRNLLFLLGIGGLMLSSCHHTTDENT